MTKPKGHPRVNHVAKATKSRPQKIRIPRGPNARHAGMIDAADVAKLAAAEYCLLHYPTLYTAGIPRPSSDSGIGVWLVPIVATHPDHGVLGEVGELTFDSRAHKVVAATPRHQVVAAGDQLYRTQRDTPPKAAAAHSADRGR